MDRGSKTKDNPIKQSFRKTNVGKNVFYYLPLKKFL